MDSLTRLVAKHKIGSTKAQLKQKKIQEIAEKVSQRMEVRDELPVPWRSA